jgi:RecB family endonuclease NucS
MLLSEAQIESWLFENPELLLQHLGDDLGAFTVSQQVRLPVAGISDMVYRHRFGISVVELKRDVIDESAVGQVLRYMGVFREMDPLVRIEGILAAPDVTPNALYAIRAVDNLRFYRIEPKVDVEWDMSDIPTGDLVGSAA